MACEASIMSCLSSQCSASLVLAVQQHHLQSLSMARAWWAVGTIRSIPVLQDKDSRGTETQSYTRQEAGPKPDQKPIALCKKTGGQKAATKLCAAAAAAAGC